MRSVRISPSTAVFSAAAAARRFAESASAASISRPCSTAISRVSASICSSREEISPISLSASACFLRTASSVPPYFRFRRPRSSSRSSTASRRAGIEREAFRIIAEREGRLLDPVVELLHLLLGELQTRVDLPDLLHGRDHAAEFGQHGAALPVEGLIGRVRKIHQLLNVREDLLLLRQGGILPRPELRPGDLADLISGEGLPAPLFLCWRS